MNQPPEPTPQSQLTTALEQALGYLARFVIGMLSSVLSDVLMTSLMIGCVFLAFQTTFLIAAAAFFIIYAILGVGSGIALSIGRRPSWPPLRPASAPILLPEQQSVDSQSSNG